MPARAELFSAIAFFEPEGRAKGSNRPKADIQERGGSTYIGDM